MKAINQNALKPCCFVLTFYTVAQISIFVQSIFARQLLKEENFADDFHQADGICPPPFFIVSWPNMAEKCRERMFQAVCDVLVEEGQVQVSWGRMNSRLRFESGWGFLATRVWFLEWEIACLCIYIYIIILN